MAIVKTAKSEKLPKRLPEKTCHDCKTSIKFEGKKIENGVLLAYEQGGEKIMAFKCNDCFQKSQELRNYQPCEVYSRIVGYLRPVQQWNKGKEQEYKERKEYVASKERC